MCLVWFLPDESLRWGGFPAVDSTASLSVSINSSKKKAFRKFYKTVKILSSPQSRSGSGKSVCKKQTVDRDSLMTVCECVCFGWQTGVLSHVFRPAAQGQRLHCWKLCQWWGMWQFVQKVWTKHHCKLQWDYVLGLWANKLKDLGFVYSFWV